MASYNELNALIDAYINRNGVQAITGQILNGVLKAMVEQLGRGYTIMGAATPTTDPGTPDGPECYFASETGTYTDFDGLQVVPGELALLCYTPSDGWTKATIYEGFQEVGATIDGNVGTPSVGVSYAGGVLSFDFRNMKGNTGDAAGFGTIGADIAGGVGTPGVSVESSGPATAKNLQFHFTNLKGETGVTSVVATVDNTTGTPACTVSLEGQQLTLAFSGLKGAQGDTGSSVDYPFTIVNNLTTDDPTQALSAAQGVVLAGELSQLEADLTGKAVIQTLYTEAYLKTSDPVGTVVNINSPVNLATWMCYMGPCLPGDVVIVNGQGGLSPRLWAFVDKDYKILSQSAASVSATNLEITAPSDAAWIIVNDCSGRSSYLVPKDSISENTLALREQKAEIDNLNGMLYHDTDIEGRLEITLDENERVVSYRKPDGTKVENIGMETPDIKANTISVNEIEISSDGVDGLIQELKSAGFTGGSGDWSDASKLAIPTPRCAVINLTSNDGTSATWPVTKTSDFEYWMQFWDMQGNYFKKRVIFNAQGNSSMAMPKKNGAIDLCNDEWEGDDTFEVKFGDWIPQDSFHIKAYYADYFVGVAVVGYEIFDQMTKTRDIYSQRDWIKYLLPSKETIGVDSQATDGLSDNLTMHNDARCFPDGFPVLVYLDGVFYGVYSWQLKKHRDNYQMNKSHANEIHLDGMISSDSIFEADGDLPWGVINGTTEAPSGGYDGIEVRNPKSLICVDGTKYDADTNRKELISTTTPGYDSSNANMVRTAQVRAAMEQLSTYVPALQTMESGGSTAAQIRAKFEECFDVESLIDYIIFGDTLGNTDGYRKNWQWMTWDGDIWAAEPYDLDALLGWSGWTNISPVLTNHYGNSKSVPTGWIIAYYADELESRYKQLRDSGILTKENIVRHLQEWVYRIGMKNFSKNHELWPYDREHYEVAPVDTRVDSIFRVSNWVEQRISYCDTLYNY